MSCFIVGVPVLYVEYYDSRQLWLPFKIMVNDISIQLVEVDIEKEFKKIKNATHMIIDRKYRYLFPYEKDVVQYTLPFPDRKKITLSEIGLLEETDFPTFERNEDGKLARITIARSKRKGFEEWCRENCRGRYHIKPEMAIFETFHDATLAKLFCS